MTQINTQKTQAQTTLSKRTCKNPTLLFIKKALTNPCLLKAFSRVLSDFVERHISLLIFSEGICNCACVIGSLDHWLDRPQRLLDQRSLSVCLWVSSRDWGITSGGENRRWAYVAGGGLWAGGGRCGGVWGGTCPWELPCLASPRTPLCLGGKSPSAIQGLPQWHSAQVHKANDGQTTKMWTKISPPPFDLGDVFCHTDETVHYDHERHDYLLTQEIGFYILHKWS